MDRRDVIADAGIRVVARDGVHALTHRRVDIEARLPAGSTSYYARTRRDLVALVAARLSDGSAGDIDQLAIPDMLGPAEAASIRASSSRRSSKPSGRTRVATRPFIASLAMR